MTASELQGKPIHILQSALGDNSTVSVQDLSVIVGREPSYTADEMQSDQWTIIAACADDEYITQASEINVGVVPKDAVDDDDIGEAQRGGFNHLIGC